MRYEGSIYRPPSEARSLILQVTIGCAHNRCTFCSMYKDKAFRVREVSEIIEDLKSARDVYPSIKRVFLADGDALVLDIDKLIAILDKINELFPECERISAYATPQDINRKSAEDLALLKEKGLLMLYMGIESGDDAILKKIDKGASSSDMLKAGLKAKTAGIMLSVTMISGLGGPRLSAAHGVNSAKLINEMQPEYASFLTLMLEEDTKLYKDYQSGEFELLSPRAVLLELRLFIQNTNLKNCVFRSNHASNYVALAGTLGEDKERLLKEIDLALKEDDYKPEYLRGL